MTWAAVKPFLVNDLILYPQKSPEKLWFAGDFGGGDKIGIMVRNGLTTFCNPYSFSFHYFPLLYTTCHLMLENIEIKGALIQGLTMMSF